MPTSGLTNKQEAFCQHYMVTGNQSEAYRQAYDTENMLPKTIHECASRLMKNRKVTARVQELQKENREVYRQSRDDLLRELDKNRELALLNVKNTSTMNQATMAKAKLLGFLDQPPAPPQLPEKRKTPPMNSLELAKRIMFLLNGSE